MTAPYIWGSFGYYQRDKGRIPPAPAGLLRRFYRSAQPGHPRGPLGAALVRLDRRHQDLALPLLDMDAFKAVNDERGHRAADTRLRDAADRLRTAVGQGGALACIGGDGFVVLLEGTDDCRTDVIAAKLVVAFTSSLPSDGYAQLGLSIGIVGYEIAKTRPQDPERQIALADQAMHQVKSAARITYRHAAPNGISGKGC
ncbi:MAG: GGDEF domain-containing protein [Thiohalorhabdus sp.]